MSRITPRSSVVVFAAAARGRNSSRTAFQSTPLMAGSKWRSLTTVQAASNVSTACGAWPRTAAAPHASATVSVTAAAMRRTVT
jgi:hypothetical protein